MSAVPGARSLPCSAFASASAYQVEPIGAPLKSRKNVVGPADPRTAEVGPQLSGSKVALTRIVTLLVRRAPQMSAACWKAINRWTPSVVPVLPPTGATGVGSLNPSLGPSLLMTVKVAARARPAGATIDVTSRANTSNPISDFTA